MTPRQPEQAQGANSGRRVARKLATGNLEDERKHSLRCLAFYSSLPKALPLSSYQATPSQTGPLNLYFDIATDATSIQPRSDTATKEQVAWEIRYERTKI
jgi:hypothetical protein